MSHINSKKILLILFLSFTFSALSFAGTKSISVELKHIENDRVVGRKVIVACTDGMPKRTLINKKSEKNWCDGTFSEICSKTKLLAAKQVCGQKYRNKVEEQGKSDSVIKSGSNERGLFDQTATLKQELMNIELQRINIAEKILELKAQELKLKQQYEEVL